MKKQGICTGCIALALATLSAVTYAAGPGGKTILHSDPLTGYQEATPAGVSSTGSGSFVASIDDVAGVIDYTLSDSHLETTAHAAHIHVGNRFTTGGISAFLSGGGGNPVCPTPGG